MSIWSRNHTELANLAKTLHDRNVQTRNNISKRLGVVSQANPLDPRKSKSESCLVSATEKESALLRTVDSEGVDEVPLMRLRVDSCSSVDSAISPDFHRGPLSPILKHTHAAYSDTKQCNGLNSSRGSDKRVTFLIENEDSDESDPAQIDSASLSNEDTESSDGKEIPILPSSKSVNIDPMSLNANGTDIRLTVPSNLPFHLEANSAHQRFFSSDSFDREEETISFDTHENVKDTVVESDFGYKKANDLSNNSNQNIDVSPKSCASLPEADGVSNQQCLDNSQRKIDGENEDDAFSTSDLNLSSELNLLLISLLANHRREQLLLSQKENGQVVTQENIDIFQKTTNNDQHIYNSYNSHELENVLTFGNVESAKISTPSTRTYRDRAIPQDIHVNNTDNTNRQSDVVCIVDDVEKQHEGVMNVDDRNTNCIENDTGFSKEKDQPNCLSLRNVAPCSTLKEIDANDFSEDLSPERLVKESSSPLLAGTPSLLTEQQVDPLLTESNASTVYFQDYLVTDSPGRYTVAGHGPSTFIYSHLYHNHCHVTPPLGGNTSMFSVATGAMDVVHQPNAIAQSGSNIAVSSEPAEDAYCIESVVVSDFSLASTEGLKSSLVRDPPFASQLNSTSFEKHEVSCACMVNTTETYDDRVSKSLQIFDSANSAISNHDAVTQTHDHGVQDISSETCEGDLTRKRLDRAANNDVIQNLAESARQKIWQHVAIDPPQTSVSLRKTVTSPGSDVRGDTNLEKTEVSDVVVSNEGENMNSSSSHADFIQKFDESRVSYIEITSDLNKTPDDQNHVAMNHQSVDRNSETTPYLFKQEHSLPQLPPPFSIQHDDATTHDFIPYENFKGKETFPVDSVSSNNGHPPLIPKRDRNTLPSSQINLFKSISLRSNRVMYSDDTTYQSSSNSFIKSTDGMCSASSCSKCQHRHGRRKPKMPSGSNLRHHESRRHIVQSESSSYDTETASLSLSRGRHTTNNIKTNTFFRREDVKKKSSWREHHNGMNDDSCWLSKSHHNSSSQDVPDNSFPNRKTRRKKKPSDDGDIRHILQDEYPNRPHGDKRRNQKGFPRQHEPRDAFLKTAQRRLSEECSTSDSVEMDGELKRLVNYLMAAHPSNLSFKDKKNQGSHSHLVKEYYNRRNKFDVSPVVSDVNQFENFKTVKDALTQLSLFLSEQQHSNKQNVMEEINSRSKLFRKIMSQTRLSQTVKQGVRIYSPMMHSESLFQSSDDGSSKLEKLFGNNHSGELLFGKASPTPSLLNVLEERLCKVDSNRKDTSFRARKADLVSIENLLDRIISAGADALCNGDVLKHVVKDWQSLKRHETVGSKPEPTLNETMAPKGTNPFHRMVQFLTQELPSSSDIQSDAPGQHCPSVSTAPVDNNVVQSNEASYEIHDKSQTDELGQAKETNVPATAFRPVTTEDDLQGDQKADVCLRASPSVSEDKEICAIMESDSQLSFRLDRDFDKNLADMKPYVLKLPLKTDRQKCAVWIKKFCDPPGSRINVRKTRNMYAQLMLQMLRKGTLASPFDQKPEEGPLQPLPSYMSLYFDDPLSSILGQAERLPDWVEGELGDTAGSSSYPNTLGNPAATSTWVSSLGDFRERPHSSMGHTLDKDPSLSPIRNSEFVQSKGYSMDDMSIEIKASPPSPPRQRRKSHNSPEREKRQLPDIKVREDKDDRRHQDRSHNDTDWSKPYASSLSLPKGTTFHEDISYHKPADREVAVRTKMIEAKFHEEKLRLQQKHDAAVQKILDRKNTEIEDVKNHYRVKSKEMEEAMGKLERKVQTLMKETDFVRESKDKQISEMKKIAEDSNETRRKEFEKRLHDIMSEFEHEKFDMQKQHTQNIQEILDDTNNRLQRMEAEYSQQTTTTTNVIKELESRVQQLMTEVDSSLSQRSAVEKDRNETQAKLEILTDEYERLKERHHQVERDHQVKTETHEHELRSLKNKTEASLEFLKQEHTMAASKASDTVSELEQKVEQLKKTLKDSEENRHRQNREMEQVHQQDKLHLENLHDKQIRNLKKEMEQLDVDWSKKSSKLEQHIKDKEAEISKLREQKQQQAIQSEQALEEFKLQVEKNQTRMYDEMKQQMDQVESDLTKSKQLREKQAKEFSRQQEEDKYKQQHENAELKMSFEGEKSQLMRDYHVQKEYIINEHDKEIENLKEMHRAEVQAMEARMRERQDKSDKVATDSERLIRELREELVQANQLRKQQLVELGLLREEEKQKVQRDHEAELSRLRTDLEQQRLEQQRAHSAEMESVLEKTNERLKSIEREYAERGNKSSESIAELQSIVLQLRGDIKRSRESSDEKLAELKHQYDEERQNLRKQYGQNMMSLQKDLETQQTKSHELERRLQREESDQEEKVTHLKIQFEEKIRGLMPAVIKQELEDTISSLKSQVSSLQQRALMLQEELESRNIGQLDPFGSRTSSPIKSTV